MPYRIMSSDSQKLVLGRESVKGSSIAAVVIGSLFFLIGIGLNYFLPSWEFPFIIFKVLFPLFGLLAIYGGSIQSKQTKETQPSKITFDHIQGAVIIEMSENDQKGFIRYDETDGFDIYVERKNSSSSGSSRASRTYYIYHVYLKKKDGGEWHLFQFNNRESAEALIAQLQSQIPFSNPFKYSVAPKLSSKIEKQEGIDKTIIHWQNKVTIGASIALIVFALVFLSVLFSFFNFGQEVEVFGSIVIGFIFLVFLFIMIITVKKLIKDATTRYAVSVDHANFEYYEFSKSTGAMKNKKTMPLSIVKSINYTFSPSINYQNAGLKVLTVEDVDREKLHKEKPFEAIKDLFSGNLALTLSITALNPVECLQLENWLQDLILKKSNVTVQ